YPSYTTSPIICTRLPWLGARQLQFCSNNIELMPSIAHGTKMGIDQCKHQFNNRRWNCKTQPVQHPRASRRGNVFGPVLERGRSIMPSITIRKSNYFLDSSNYLTEQRASREAAFVHAIAAAGVAYSVTKACSTGTLRSCGCDNRVKGKKSIGVKWSWGECNDNVQVGVAASRKFADATDQGSDARSIMNRHNNEAGRQVLLRGMRFICKCHGVSGSCQFQTCFWSLPRFSSVGAELKRMFIDAQKMRVERHLETRGWVESLVRGAETVRSPTTNDLVYYEESPDFCERNVSLGIEGTRGRLCNATSSGVDNCDLLCCGRGYTTTPRTRVERCRCTFQWCCKVTCDQCTVHYEEHRCN
uniref:Protein Wnt n=1 Tax=Ciona savignyi TaxID=51511 RepID=H2YTF4_CIOSA